MQREVDARRVPGVAMLIARGGKVGYRRDIGALRPGGPALPGDAIFRIYSMTKPIVSVALMMLVEEGRLFIADPIAKFIPEFANPKVGVERDGKLELVAAKRPITIQDLLRHTSGLTYAFTGNSAVQRLYVESRLFTTDPGNAKEFLTRDLSTAEFIVELARLPLINQPGTSWDYSHSTDVIGRVVEIVSGQSLGAFLQDRILGPLGMRDTGFFVPADKHDRLAEAFANDPDTGAPVQLIDARTAPRFESGGGGLFSTMDDYLRFAQMLYLGGALGGTRLLGRKNSRIHDRRPPRAACPHRNQFPAAAGTRFRPRLCGSPRCRHGADPRHAGRILLGRRRRHGILDRAQGRVDRVDDDPSAKTTRLLPPDVSQSCPRGARLARNRSENRPPLFRMMR